MNLMKITIGTINLTLNFSGKDPTLPDVVKSVTESIKSVYPINKGGVGVARRPSAEELARRKEPQSVKDAKQAVKESLDNIPELRALKEKNQVKPII